MSDKLEGTTGKKQIDKNIIWIGVAVAALVIGVLVYQSQKKEIVSISVGGKEISATYKK